MAGILGSSTPAGKFVDPKAQILYGKGNNKYTPEQIKQWIKCLRNEATKNNTNNTIHSSFEGEGRT